MEKLTPLPEGALSRRSFLMHGAATDEIWQIERRERWAARQSPESFAFRWQRQWRLPRRDRRVKSDK